LYVVFNSVFTRNSFARCSGETDTTDNTLTGGSIVIAIVGDLTGPTFGVPDGKVDARDIAFVAKAFGTYEGKSRWNPNADINNDGKVDAKDLAVPCKNFGKTDP
jgi:hypothetical protein